MSIRLIAQRGAAGLLLPLLLLLTGIGGAEPTQPNMLLIMGDDCPASD